MSALRDAALAYAARGWSVFPLRPCEKLPLIPKREGGNGVHDATTNTDQILAWWDHWPNANIGLACGPHFWVLDVDYAGWAAAKPDGLDAYLALVRRYGRLPSTVTQITGGGGYQHLFKADTRIKNGVKLLPGLDTRSTGGYVVAPPSIHPSGRSYRWRAAHSPDEIEIATAPEWLIALAEPVEIETAAPVVPRPVAQLDRYVAAALASACDAIARSAPGQQEETLAREAFGIGRLAAGGALPAGEARAHLAAAGRQMSSMPGRRPWTPNEIDWRISRAFAAAASRPRTVEAR